MRLTHRRGTPHQRDSLTSLTRRQFTLREDNHMRMDPTLRAAFKVLHWVCLFAGAVLGTMALVAVIVLTAMKGPGFWTLKTVAPVFFTALLAVLLALLSRQFRTA